MACWIMLKNTSKYNKQSKNDVIMLYYYNNNERRAMTNEWTNNPSLNSKP
jgi:hypothetical protein